MPEPTHIMDTGLPRFKVTDTTEEKVNAIQEYLYMLLEELRYYLQHLTEDNFTAEGAQALVSQAISGKEGQSAITPAAQEIITLTEAPRFSSLNVDTANGKVRYTVEGDPTQYVLSFVKNGDTATYTWPDGFQCEVAIDSSMTQSELMLSTLIALCTPAKRVREKPVPAKEPPAPPVYLTFSSPYAFWPITIETADRRAHWDGSLEYSTDTQNWTVWDGTTRLSSVDGYLYLRGTGNTVITGDSMSGRWIMDGARVSCTGNIESLLDHAAVSGRVHPSMADSCFAYLFSWCTNLVVAPELPATTLADNCYAGMFQGCTGLTTAPELPATTLAEYCYQGMFDGCTGLTTAPELPATTLSEFCYNAMFRDCTGLTTAPELPATTLANNCYSGMFDGCTGLTTAPELPATTLATGCYSTMFIACTGLTTAPELPATTLAEYCYQSMFWGCTALATAPMLPATTLPYLCYMDMFRNCTSLRLSETRVGAYTYEYRIPGSGTGTEENPGYSAPEMFYNTGGTFTGTPAINTTYYTTNPPV